MKKQSDNRGRAAARAGRGGGVVDSTMGEHTRTARAARDGVCVRVEEEAEAEEEEIQEVGAGGKGG